MTKRVFAVAAVGVAAVLVAGGLVASNMGFKANYHLDALGDNGSVAGAQTLALPYNQQSGLNVAEDLINDINTDAGGAVVDTVSRVLRTTDGKETYSLVSGGTNFALMGSEGYIVTVTASADYIMVGSHDPALPINLDSPGTNGSLSGTQLWGMPYHFTGATAEDLILELEAHGNPGDVDSVSSLARTSPSPVTYSLVSGGTNFSLVPGEAYVIVVINDITGWIPSHY
jgi:hypothetical protein